MFRRLSTRADKGVLGDHKEPLASRVPRQGFPRDGGLSAQSDPGDPYRNENNETDSQLETASDTRNWDRRDIDQTEYTGNRGPEYPTMYQESAREIRRILQYPVNERELGPQDQLRLHR